MKQLKDKIDNLRLNLKRPNEILLTYKDLIKKSNRDENILTEVEVLKFEIGPEFTKLM